MVVNAEPPGEPLAARHDPVLASARRSCSWRCSSGCSGAPPQSAGGGGVIGQFGRSRAKRVEAETQTVTFDDVAGIDEAEDELVEVVDFLRNPRSTRKLGARIPRGVLLSGPARHRQDAAGPRRGRRGRRAVLLRLGVGVHRGDRGRRRLARARPVPAGQGGRARDHLHRRARRDRPRARRRRRLARRPRRARADAQPDPHRDGRLRPRRPA